MIDYDKVLRDCCDAHLKVAAQYEQGGNFSGAMQLRAVANLLGVIVQGGTPVTILPPPKSEEFQRKLVPATYVQETICDRDGVGTLTSPCMFDPDTKFVTNITDDFGLAMGVEMLREFVRLKDGTILTEDDGVVFDY